MTNRSRIRQRRTAFISYRRLPSAALAQLLAEKLKDDGIDAFVDTRQTDGAGPFPVRLLRAIEERDVFICLLADTTLDSEWVGREIEHAHTLGKPMIPVFQESYKPITQPPTPHVEALLQYDGVHVLDQRGLFIEDAIRNLAQMIHRTAEAQAAPPTRGVRLALPLTLVVVAALIVAGILLITASQQQGAGAQTPTTTQRIAQNPTDTRTSTRTSAPAPTTVRVTVTSSIPAPTDISVQFVEAIQFPDKPDDLTVRTFFSVIGSDQQPVVDPKIRLANIVLDTADGGSYKAEVRKADSPIAIALVLDASGSMGRNIPAMQQAAKALVGGLGGEARFIIMRFNDQIDVLTDFISDKAQLEAAINEVRSRPNAGTCLYDATFRALELVAANAPTGRRAVVVFTDGVDESTATGQPCSKATVTDVIDLANNTLVRIPLYTIGFRASANARIAEADLRNMGLSTNGSFTIGEDLPTLFTEIKNAIEAQQMAEALVRPRAGEIVGRLQIVMETGNSLAPGVIQFTSPRDYSFKTPTPTFTPTETPNAQTLAAQRFAAAQTQTAASWTKTPTYTHTPAPTYTPTIDLEATITAQIATWFQQTIDAYTNTPTPAETPTSTFTPTATATPTPTPPPAGAQRVDAKGVAQV